jgi:hypothetical protein
MCNAPKGRIRGGAVEFQEPLAGWLVKGAVSAVVVVPPCQAVLAARRLEFRHSQLSLAFRISLERRIRLRESAYSGAGP